MNREEAAGPGWDAAHIARHGTPAARARLGRGGNTAPELLYYLAADPLPDVRRAVAGNGATPLQADQLLAADNADAVRATLGRKLAAIAPSLAAGREERLGRLAWETLSRLVADTAETVRAAISDVLQSMPDAPHELVLRLAQDVAMPVAEPLLRLSPVLTEADLLALVNGPPVPETVTALARRPGLSAAVADAIVARGDPVLVGVLLDNPSAAIREASLDALIASAAGQPDWHPPLVRRPGLSAGALRALAGFIASHLLDALAARTDLPADLPARIAARLEHRLEGPPALPENPVAAARADPMGAAPGPAREFSPVAAAGGAVGLPPPLGTPEQAFHRAAERGDALGMLHILAQAANVRPAALRRVVGLRNAKALVSLCWRAGFTLTSAVLAQGALGQVPPGSVLHFGKDGGWPLQRREMEWQLELMDEPAAS